MIPSLPLRRSLSCSILTHNEVRFISFWFTRFATFKFFSKMSADCKRTRWLRKFSQNQYEEVVQRGQMNYYGRVTTGREIPEPTPGVIKLYDSVGRNLAHPTGLRTVSRINFCLSWRPLATSIITQYGCLAQWCQVCVLAPYLSTTPSQKWPGEVPERYFTISYHFVEEIVFKIDRFENSGRGPGDPEQRCVKILLIIMYNYQSS